ncbi:hypothetical protein BFJ63_vAg14378 [Fusarium oxysporum f. sp. narcissi]|uniref:Uncharacterized protein n=1 Tax=Fusarium oxysporum f. sp. narcissi TaxID=451672 RepID=A0A4Q2V7E4_FUSOX|nr:hypothetical protein BFJ63_vAg14378 [Fusarium oxysporum f. sp. narcissi]
MSILFVASLQLSLVALGLLTHHLWTAHGLTPNFMISYDYYCGI